MRFKNFKYLAALPWLVQIRQKKLGYTVPLVFIEHCSFDMKKKQFGPNYILSARLWSFNLNHENETPK